MVNCGFLTMQPSPWGTPQEKGAHPYLTPRHGVAPMRRMGPTGHRGRDIESDAVEGSPADAEEGSPADDR
jgi:hypothetical protein